MQSISEIIQTIARQRGRGDTQPLLTLLQIAGATGERISHLPIDAELAQAWVPLTGEPFRPHQAHALTAFRRGEPVALRAASADVAMTAYLLLYATLIADPSATALLLAPDEAGVQAARARLTRINQELPRGLQFQATLPDPQRRPEHYARIVIATPEIVHSRLLRHHDRAWRLFWPRLRLVVLPEVQSYTGVAAAHLADLLTRIQRVAINHSGQIPNLLATLTEVAEAEPALTNLLGHPWRIVPADDGGREPVDLAVWRGGAAWARDAAEIAIAMQRQGYQVHIACRPIERALLAPIIDDLPHITFGPNMGAGQVLVAAGYPGSHSALRRMLRAGYRAVILVLGELPHEQALALHVETLISDPAAVWIPPPANAYVLARHILCAASELPLTETEVAAWGARDIVDRLVERGQLVDLPDPEVSWKPTDAAGDPYMDWSLHSASGAAITARTEQGQVVDTVEPAAYERWAFPNAALAPGMGGFRILSRDEETGVITLRLESNGRRTYPLRRCDITLRETHETRAMAGNRPVGWGRVVVSEEIYGFREASAGSAPADVALKPPLHARWTAPACWFDLSAAVQVSGQFIGWSLAAALPLRALAAFTDVVSCYDHEARRLYLVDAQPGGNGLAQWAYAHAEELLPLAYDIALACRGDPLLEPLSRVDMDWLLTLLGRQAADATASERSRVAEPMHAAPPRPLELIEGPPPPAPRVITPPAPPDQRPRYGEASAPAAPTATSADQWAPNAAAPNEQRPATNDQHHAPAATPAAPRKPSRERQPEPPARVNPPQQDMFAPHEQRARDPDEQRSRPPDRPKPTAPARSFQKGPPETSSAREPQRPATRAPQEPPVARQSGHPGDSPPPAARPVPARKSNDDDAAPDPNALIERLRRQREQREAEQAAVNARTSRRVEPQASDDTEVEQRFAAGERVFCLPYGDGVVRASHVEGGRELLTVTFSTHGDLTIDPALSLVRKLEDAPQEDDDLL